MKVVGSNIQKATPSKGMNQGKSLEEFTNFLPNERSAQEDRDKDGPLKSTDPSPSALGRPDLAF